MAGKGPSDAFEIAVVLAIVAIVAVTGQVLIYFEQHGGGSAAGEQVTITGFAVADDFAAEVPKNVGHIDVSVEKVEVLPPSPLIGDPFRVKVTLKNKGTAATGTPFYVEARFEPRMADVNFDPMMLYEVMPKSLGPGEESSVSFLVTTIVPEGPLRIVATADSSYKLEDGNLGNNQMSKTVIVAVE